MRSHSLLLPILLVLTAAASCSGATKVFTDPNSSMEPTILKDEKVLADMGAFQPNRGDLIIFKHQEGQTPLLVIKRVIGIAGDVVEGRNLQVFVNGKQLQEPYVEHTAKRPLGLPTLETFGPTKVPAGMLFVMGDNRDYSFDSRDPRFGLVPVSDVEGRPVQVVQSPDPQRVGRKLQ